jgi:hypothetical protein
MRCEYCKKTIYQGDIAHGIRYGTVDVFKEIFLPAQDSATTIICDQCGEKVYQLVYASLDEGKVAYPVIFNMYNELTMLMKNGYKLIQSIATLPRADQQALQHLINICKSAR